MGIEEQIDKLIDLGDDIKSRLDLLVELATDHFAGADKMVADEPAKEPGPAWEPKVGDWVRVTRPVDWKEWKEPMWQEKMHHFDGKVLQVSGAFETSFGHRVKLHGIDWFFHRDWLTPSIRHFAEPPKPAEPEYREPVLPGDAGQPCEFSMTGKDWYKGLLAGFHIDNTHPWSSSNLGRWNFARIKKDA